MTDPAIGQLAYAPGTSKSSALCYLDISRSRELWFKGDFREWKHLLRIGD